MVSFWQKKICSQKIVFVLKQKIWCNLIEISVIPLIICPIVNKFDLENGIKENVSCPKGFYYHRTVWVRNWQVYVIESSVIHLIYKKSVRI